MFLENIWNILQKRKQYSNHNLLTQGKKNTYKILHEFFSRNGFTFWLENPFSRQSSLSCSSMYFIISWHACDTCMRGTFASRRSCSLMMRCCCRLAAIMSSTAVSASPMLLTLLKDVDRRYLVGSWWSWSCDWILWQTHVRQKSDQRGCVNM